MKTFRTNSRLNKLMKNEDINLINNISKELFNIEFNSLPINYKNIVFNKYIEKVEKLSKKAKRNN